MLLGTFKYFWELKKDKGEIKHVLILSTVPPTSLAAIFKIIADMENRKLKICISKRDYALENYH